MKMKLIQWVCAACALPVLLFLTSGELSAQLSTPIPTPSPGGFGPPPPPHDTPTLIPTPTPSGPAAFVLGTQLPALSLSYVVNGTGKTLAVSEDWYPDHKDFEPIAIYPDQTLQINLQFPPDYAGQIISVEIAEENSGASITSTTPIAVATGTDSSAGTGVNLSGPTTSIAAPIGTDGRVSIGFQAPHDPGLYHIRFGIGPLEPLLPLGVLDPNQPAHVPNCKVAN